MRIAVRFRAEKLFLVGKRHALVSRELQVILGIHHRPNGDMWFLEIIDPVFATLAEALPLAERLQEEMRKDVGDHFDIFVRPTISDSYISLGQYAAQMEPAAATSEAWRRAATGHEDDFFQSTRHPMAGSHGL